MNVNGLISWSTNHNSLKIQRLGFSFKREREREKKDRNMKIEVMGNALRRWHWVGRSPINICISARRVSLRNMYTDDAAVALNSPIFFRGFDSFRGNSSLAGLYTQIRSNPCVNYDFGCELNYLKPDWSFYIFLVITFLLSARSLCSCMANDE